ncbi:hypothetical protein ACKVF7_000914 [Escherichia coli]|nr:hypothetical protein [Escherichia coli]
MANVVNKPGWVGSSAVSVTSQRWMTAAMNALKVSRPANMSAMCGRGMDTVVATAAWSTSLGNNWGVTASNYPVSGMQSKGSMENPENVGVGRLIGVIVGQFNGGTPTMAVYLQNGRAGNITVNLGGAAVTVPYNSMQSGFHYYWLSNPPAAFLTNIKKTGTKQTLKIT